MLIMEALETGGKMTRVSSIPARTNLIPPSTRKFKVPSLLQGKPDEQTEQRVPQVSLSIRYIGWTDHART